MQRELTIVEKIYTEMFEAFCTLSDAQELISMDENDRAISLINHAKEHMIKASKYDEEAYRTGMVNVSFICKLDEELSEVN